MSTFNPAIPIGTNLLSVDYKAIQLNFQQLDTSFGVNHVPFSVAPNNGKHTFVEMIVSAALPIGLAALEGTLYTKTYKGQSALYYTPDNTTREYQLTLDNSGGVFGNPIQGWIFLPGGIILNYGKVTGLSDHWPSGTQTVNYNSPNTNFPATGFSVMTSFIGPGSSSSGDIAIIATNTNNFQWNFGGSSSASFDGFYWWSFGQ